MKFASVWGTYEPLWQDMRKFRDKMTAAGHPFAWKELPEGHSWGQWRANLDFILEFIFPAVPTAVGSSHNLESFELLQNYPNPFNPSTNFRFQTADYKWVTLSVYDINGREVATLVNERKSPGEYSVSWNASESPSGVYYYVLRSGGREFVRKMVLIK